MNKDNKKHFSSILVFVIIIAVVILIPLAIHIHRERAVQRNLDEHFGNIRLSEDEISSLADSIVSSPTDSSSNDDNDFNGSDDSGTATIDSDFSNSEDSSHEYTETEIEIINSPTFKNALSEALVQLDVNEILDMYIELDESFTDNSRLNAYVKTDIHTLTISMFHLGVVDKWSCYQITDTDTGHFYYCPEETAGYHDIYDYATDELISPKYMYYE